MNKSTLLLVSASLLLGGRMASAQMLLPAAAPMPATISATASPSSQTVMAGGTFTVSISLTVSTGTGPANVDGFDLFLVTASANSGYFKITGAVATGAINSNGPDDSAGDPLSIAASNGYVRNGIDQQFSTTTANAQPVPTTNLPLESLTLTVAPGTPQATYIFQTSTMTTAGAATYSSISDSSGGTFEITSPGTFMITVVPEPSTYALLAGGAGLLGVVSYRRRNRPLAV